MAKPRKALEREPRQLGFSTVGSLAEELEEMHKAIARRAHEIFSGRAAGGQDMDDWLRAERELSWSPAIELAEEDGVMRLEAAVAGFEPDDLDVQLTPDEVLIRSGNPHDHRGFEGSVYCCEFGRGQLFRSVHLPHSIDPERAKAKYRNGLLSITAPLSEAPPPGNLRITDS